MKKIMILAVAGLALASVAAYAQMQHGGEGMGMPMQHGNGRMMGPGPMMGQGQMMGHGQMMGAGMPGSPGDHGHSSGPKGDSGPSSLAFHGINLKMHEGMDIAFTGNADVDFVRGMIPHHQGAVDMAKTVLAFGTDPELKKLAEGIIEAQQREIAFMQAWAKKTGH